jgi:hypothetical protein
LIKPAGRIDHPSAAYHNALAHESHFTAYR